MPDASSSLNENDSALPILPPVVGCASSSSDALAIQALPRPSHSAPGARSLVEQLVTAGALVGRASVGFDRLLGVRLETVLDLCAKGALVGTENEFGEMQVALDPASLTWDSMTAIARSVPIIRLSTSAAPLKKADWRSLFPCTTRVGLLATQKRTLGWLLRPVCIGILDESL